MSVKKEPSGRRSVSVEVEVPGTPEQVWNAIATGPGISSWFVPTKVDGRVGGTIACSFGPGMESGAQITTWEPPRRLVAEDSTWLQGGPPVATEWVVEARGGGKCVVRVVHSLFASTDQWDGQLEGTEHGWPTFFRVLLAYLERYAGQPSAQLQAMAMASGTSDEAWAKLLRELGIVTPREGAALHSAIHGAAPFAGTIVRLTHNPDGHGLEARLSEPTPGTLLLGAYVCGGMLMVTLQAYLYGAQAANAVTRDAEAWQHWLAAKFPAPAAAPTAG